MKTLKKMESDMLAGPEVVSGPGMWFWEWRRCLSLGSDPAQGCRENLSSVAPVVTLWSAPHDLGHPTQGLSQNTQGCRGGI